MPYPIDNLPPIHPGRIVRQELDALGMNAQRFADHIHVPHNVVAEIINCDRSITAQMAIRLGLAFGTTPQYWMNLQDLYELKVAKAELPAEATQIVCLAKP